jgi:beta-glucosidase
MTVDTLVDEHTLREIYLLPFERAVEVGAWTVMTAYNRLNGSYCAEHVDLLRRLLREEWEWDGVIMSDWYGTHDTVRSACAGLDLEMPGPPRYFGPALADAIRGGHVDDLMLHAQVDRLQRLASRVGSKEPMVVQDDPQSLLVGAAAASFVLLKDELQLLPLRGDEIRSIAVLGPNAHEPAIQGGGACHVAAPETETPLEAISSMLEGSTEIVFEAGCSSRCALPGLHRLGVRATHDRAAEGFTVDYLVHDGSRLRTMATETRNTSFLWFIGESLADGASLVRLSGVLTPAVSGVYTFGVRASGRTRLVVDDLTLVSTSGPTANAVDHMARVFTGDDVRGEIELTAGKPAYVCIEMELDGGPTSSLAVGACEPQSDDAIGRAVKAATDADAAVLIVGTNSEVECEGVDRTTTKLPGVQEELVRAVLAANPRTVVVVNAGAAVDVSWAVDASTVLYVWFPGQEFGQALAAVLTGELEPGGRLPVTLAEPSDYPAWSTAPDENGQLAYNEGVFVGYRHLDRAGRTPFFCFGHGLSYTDFAYEAISVRSRDTPSLEVEVGVKLRNVGGRRGKEVVQLYVTDSVSRVERPKRELKAYETAVIDAGESVEVRLTLDARSFAYWDPDEHAWRLTPGIYTIHVGRSSRDLRLSAEVVVTNASEG